MKNYTINVEAYSREFGSGNLVSDFMSGNYGIKINFNINNNFNQEFIIRKIDAIDLIEKIKMAIEQAEKCRVN